VAEAQRLSNNFRPKFTDEECMTIYLFGIAEGKFELKAIYQFIKDYWADWFPALPSYQNFNRRVNLLADAFRALCTLLITERGINENVHTHLLDSMPITVASSKRSSWAKAAKGLCDKGFCPTKGTWYYGVKLHVLGQKRYEALPNLCMAHIAPASLHDVTIAKEWLMDAVRNIDIFADKAYVDQAFSERMALQNVNLFLCVRKKIGQEFLEAADEVFSYAVSRTRQAIESFFNWIQQKTHIQSASKVRSDNGLIAFIFARLAALALFYS
jgi:hypothetical protein